MSYITPGKDANGEDIKLHYTKSISNYGAVLIFSWARQKRSK